MSTSVDTHEATTSVEDALRDILEAEKLFAFGAPISITRLSGGHSHVTWMASQTDPSGQTERLVVKVAQPDGPLAPYDIGHEVKFTDLGRAQGLPCPEVVFTCQDSPVGAPFFVMKFVAGDAPTPPEILAWLEENPTVSPRDLATQVVRTLLVMGAVVDTDETATTRAKFYRDYVQDAFDSLATALDGICPMPAGVELAHQALLERSQILGDGPLSLVQGDFRFGNLLLENGGIAAILDWERGMWGHPLHDLAYLSLPSMRYHGRIAGLIDEAEMLELWTAETGESIDTDALSFLQAVSIFTELCSCARALCAYSRGRGRTSLLKILPIIARHELDLLSAIDWSHNGTAY